MSSNIQLKTIYTRESAAEKIQGWIRRRFEAMRAKEQAQKEI